MLVFVLSRYSKIAINFLNYWNPSNNKATGVKCDNEDGEDEFCEIYIEICVSKLGERYAAIQLVVSYYTMKLCS